MAFNTNPIFFYCIRCATFLWSIDQAELKLRHKGWNLGVSNDKSWEKVANNLIANVGKERVEFPQPKETVMSNDINE